ncbi:MAG: PIG-L family deacetylase [Actinomycetota bacterium]|nr:PIG-L family deacetylase [Actinomycetota bacterium]
MNARRTLAAVVAHPDDDTFTAAGLVAKRADDPGFRFVLIHATSGEAGQIADPDLATPETLASVREEEDRRSWVTLGREPDRHEWLRYPDHGLEFEPFDRLVEAVAAILREERPDVVVTFGPDGITGHPDHITIGYVTDEAFARLNTEGVPGFRRLLHAALPETVIESWNQTLVDSGREPFDPTQLYQPRGVPDAAIGFEIDTSDVAPLVVAALREHRTQAGDIDEMTDEEQLRLASKAWFVTASPEPSPSAGVLADVFDNLA